MKYPNYKYVDTAFGKISNRNKIQETDQIQLPNEPIDCYRTYFRFDSLYIDHFNKNDKSISQYRGKCISDYIPIDIDNTNLNESLRTGRDFVNYLYYDLDIQYESLGIYFSGSKGFHVNIPLTLLGVVEPSENLPLRFKKFVLSFGNWGFDLKIYDKARLWRLENSINSKSGLYKIRLYGRELLDLSIDEIKVLAKVPRENSGFSSYNDFEVNLQLASIWEETGTIVAPKTKITFSHPKDKIDFLNKGVSKGSRNNTTFDYAKKLKIIGYNEPDTVEQLIQWNHLNSPPLAEKEVKRTIRSVFSFDIGDSDSIGIRRLFRDDKIYKDFNSEQRDIYVQIISRVNTKPKAWCWKGRMYYCNAGEFICSNQSLADFCSKNVNRDTVRYALDKLEEEGKIIMQRLDGRDGKKIILIDSKYTEKCTPDIK